MAPSILKGKWLWIIIISTILLIGLISLKFISERKVLNAINNAESGHKFEVRDVDLSIFSESVRLTDVKISPQDDLIKDTSKNYIEATAQQFLLSGVSIPELLLNNKFDADLLLVDNLDVSLYRKQIDSSDSSDVTHQGSQNQIWKIISSGILINGLELKDCSYKFYYSHDNSNLQLSAEPVNIRITDLSTDSAMVHRDKPFDLKNAIISIKNIKYHDVDSLFDYTIQKMDYKDKQLTIYGIKYSPNYPVHETSVKKGIQTDIPTVKVKSITLFNPVIDSLDAYIKLDSMLVDSAGLELFRNKNLPLPKQPIKPLFAGMIKSTPVKFFIPKLILKNSSVKYSEKQINVDADLLKLNITSLNVEVFNLTNLADKISLNSDYTINARSEFMNGTDLLINITGNYNSSDQSFNVKGKLSRMKMSALNSFVTPITHMKIAGNLEPLTFSFTGNNYRSNGWLLMPYTNLKVELFHKHKTSKVKPVESFLANTLLDSDNQLGNKHFHYGEIKFDRVKTKSVFHFMANSLKTGAISTLLKKHKGMPPGYASSK
ncbi:AsmA family protein [Mangrovivirga cuniculi]|uniref:AsmA-like C-terminal domain-containing protein n=1 Tax=Mangrovivirga cuniculi TaxID=2715131 RepID=A0A4D7JEB6_9BACT|nr:hypothetical protein [Mangrovivirga cuniculi]QCK14579.1 hypothetical protein DCC35_07400 [Mangrovivirga cuniculi]